MNGRNAGIPNVTGIVTAQAAPPCPPILGEKAFGSPRIGGQGGALGAIETILTAWLSSYPESRL